MQFGALGSTVQGCSLRRATQRRLQPESKWHCPVETGFGHTHNGHTLISISAQPIRYRWLMLSLGDSPPWLTGSLLAPLWRSSGSLAPAMGNATTPTDACPSSLLLSTRLPAPAALPPPMRPPCSPHHAPPWSPLVHLFHGIEGLHGGSLLVVVWSLVVREGSPCCHV